MSINRRIDHVSMYGGWHWARREQGLDALTEWIDEQHRSSGHQRWGIWGAVVGSTSGLVGASFGVLLGAMNLSSSNPVVYVPLAAWLILTGGMTAWVVRKNREDQARWSREARGFMTRLLVARWHGNMSTLLGEQGSKTMNEAARAFLQCKASLNSPAWKAAAAGQVWAEVRDKTTRSMDSAMARLLINIASGVAEGENEAILHDMRSMNDEVAKASKRHALASGAPLEGADGLRQTLAELKELASADEEFLEDRLKF